MSDKELLDKEISKETDLKIEVKDKKLRMEISYDGNGANAGVFVELEAVYFIDKLAEAIPGEIDDVILNSIKAAL